MNRVRGCLLGQAIGDALGARYEFESAEKVVRHIRQDMEGGPHLPMLGGGPFDLLPGQITDDTELALANLHVLIKHHRFDANLTAQAYVEWHLSHPFDQGSTIKRACAQTSLSRSPATNRQQMISQASPSSLSNGSLMRISPIAIAYGQSAPEELLEVVNQDSELTHNHELIGLASTAYALAIGSLINHGGNRLVAYQAACNFALNKNHLLYRILKAAQLRPDPVELIDGALTTTDSSYAGYFGIALQNAFYELLNGQSFEQSMISVIIRGGDTDTNAAITGALLGAYYGLQSIPTQWVATVIQANPVERHKEYPRGNTQHLIDLADRLYQIYIAQ